MKIHKIFSILFVGTIAGSSGLLAKGLDGLKPVPPPTPAPAAATTAPVAPSTPPPPAAAPAGAPIVTPPVDGVPAATSETTVTQSATSKALNDKLSIGTGFGFYMASASEGEWSSRGGAELAAYYVLPYVTHSAWSLSGSFRYATFDATAVLDRLSYRGTVEGYHLGAMARIGRNTKMSFIGSGEVGMMVVHMYSLERVEVDDKLNSNGVNVTLGGGVDWQLQPKLFLGPRLGLGFGRLQTVQLSGNATFMF